MYYMTFQEKIMCKKTVYNIKKTFEKFVKERRINEKWQKVHEN